jgi:hypothetical protein
MQTERALKRVEFRETRVTIILFYIRKFIPKHRGDYSQACTTNNIAFQCRFNESLHALRQNSSFSNIFYPTKTPVSCVFTLIRHRIRMMLQQQS